MRASDMLRWSFGNLGRQKLRTFLTVFGVVVGTGAITLMVSLGIGLQSQTVEFFNRVDILTTVTVFSQKRSTSIMTFGKPLGSATMKLDEEALEDLRRIPGVLAVFPELDINGRIQVERMMEGKKRAELGGWVRYIGLPQVAILPAYRKQTLAGNFWSEEKPGEPVCVVPADVLYEMGIGPPIAGHAKPGEKPAGRGDPRWNDVLGLTVKIQFNAPVPREDREKEKEKVKEKVKEKDEEAKDPEEPSSSPPDSSETEVVSRKVVRRFRIVGVYDPADIGMPMVPSVFVPLSQGLEMMRIRSRDNPDASYKTVIVKAKDASLTDQVQRDIDAKGYGTMTIQDIVQMIGYVFLTLKAVLGAVGAIGLIVAFFGIANTMIMAILERTREIGVMKALGARNIEIRGLFIFEAAAIGGVGAACGIAGGWAFGKGLNAIVAWFVKARGGPEGVYLFQVSPWLAGGVLGFAVVVAVVAGLYPAWRASKLDPVAALRSL